jgi:hypothetical protein
MLMIAIFAAMADVSAASSFEQSKRGLELQYRAVMKAWDKDRDQRLSHAEIDRMIGSSLISPEPLDAEAYATFEAQVRKFYADQDANADGFIDLDEIRAGPLRTFTCFDANGDDRVTRKEVDDGVIKCGF